AAVLRDAADAPRDAAQAGDEGGVVVLLEDVREDLLLDALHLALRLDGLVGELEVVAEDAGKPVLHDARGDVAHALDALHQGRLDLGAALQDVQHALGDVVGVVRDVLQVLADEAVAHDGELVHDADLLGHLRIDLRGEEQAKREPVDHVGLVLAAAGVLREARLAGGQRLDGLLLHGGADGVEALDHRLHGEARRVDATLQLDGVGRLQHDAQAHELGHGCAHLLDVLAADARLALDDQVVAANHIVAHDDAAQHALVRRHVRVHDVHGVADARPAELAGGDAQAAVAQVLEEEDVPLLDPGALGPLLGRLTLRVDVPTFWTFRLSTDMNLGLAVSRIISKYIFSRPGGPAATSPRQPLWG